MLLPILCPEKGTAPDVLSDLLNLLKKAFFLPSLYLEQDTVALTGQPGVTEKAEKIYVALGEGSGVGEIVHTLCSEAILEDLCTDLESRRSPVDTVCPPAIILSVAEGKAYGCLEGFSRHFPLMEYAKNPDVETLMVRYGEAGRRVQECLACKEARIKALTEVPITAQRAKECGALFYRFGMRHQEALDYARAAESFNRSLRLSPEAEAPAIRFRLGLCLRNMGLHDQALEAFEKSRSAYGDRHYFHFYTGLCYYEKGDLAAAVERFSEAAAMGSDTEDLVSILIYLGTCYNGLGRYREALASLGEAQALAPNVKEVYSMSGFSHYKLGEYDEAVKNLERAIDIDPGSAMDYASLGANYREMGELETAVSMFEKALELDAGLVHARKGLEGVRQRL
jgi:tetratricopeptide (TPR) repeat protein